MTEKETQERKKFGFIDALRRELGAYNLFRNVIYLFFLKYVVTYPDRLGVYDVDGFKAVSAFKRKYDGARMWKEPLNVGDIEEVLRVIDNSSNLGGVRLADAAKNYFGFMSDSCAQVRLLNLLDGIDLQYDKEHLEALLEQLIYRSHIDVRNTGGNVTNKSLRKLASSLLEVKDNETYLDCFCGFSTTLLDVDSYKDYIGYELNADAAAVSKMILIMLGKKNFEIRVDDFYWAETHEIADKVFSDGPICVCREDSPLCAEFGVQTKDMDVLSLYKILDSVKPGGTAVITVPGKTLYSGSRGYGDLRNRFLEAGLKAVISLPGLWSGTSLFTNLLVIRKGYKGNVEFVDAQSLGVSDRRLTLLPPNVIERILNSVKNGIDETDFSKSVTREEVLSKGDWLPTSYLAQEKVCDYRSVETIDSELNSFYEELKKNL